MRRSSHALLALGLLVVAPRAALTQRIAPAGATYATRLAAVRDTAPLGTVGSVPHAAQRRSLKRYALLGAATGAALTAIGIVLYAANANEECLGCGPFIFVPAIAAGAAVGALVGIVVYVTTGPPKGSRVTPRLR